MAESQLSVAMLVVYGRWIAGWQTSCEDKVVRSVERTIPSDSSDLLISTIQTPETELGCPTSTSGVGCTPKQVGHINRRA